METSQTGHIDKTVLVPAPQNCLHCNCSDLTPIEDIKDHLQKDIVLQAQHFEGCSDSSTFVFDVT